MYQFSIMFKLMIPSCKIIDILYFQIERSNYFLNAIVQTAKRGETVDDRTTACLLTVSIITK